MKKEIERQNKEIDELKRLNMTLDVRLKNVELFLRLYHGRGIMPEKAGVERETKVSKCKKGSCSKGD